MVGFIGFLVLLLTQMLIKNMKLNPILIAIIATADAYFIFRWTGKYYKAPLEVPEYFHIPGHDSSAPAAPKIQKCPQCGMMQVVQGGHCKACGAGMPSVRVAPPRPTTVTCKACGEVNPSFELNCGKCGQRLS